MDASAPTRQVIAAPVMLSHGAVLPYFRNKVNECTVLSLSLMCLLRKFRPHLYIGLWIHLLDLEYKRKLCSSVGMLIYGEK